MPGKFLRSVLIGLIVGGLLLAVMPSLRQWQLSTTTQYDSADESPASYNSAVRRAAPAVVNVYNRALNGTSHNQLTLGSGVIMDQRGYILTNKHVINDADQIIVALQDGRVFEALLVGSDTLTDLAVLKINANAGLPVIPINPKRVPHIGDVVLAIGNPYARDYQRYRSYRPEPDRTAKFPANRRLNQPRQLRRCAGELAGRTDGHQHAVI